MTQKSTIESSKMHVNREVEADAEKRLSRPDSVHEASSSRNYNFSTESYKGLVVWQRAIDMVDAVYDLTRGFPHAERFALSDQMRRAAISVPSNIAEGYGRNTTGEYKQFLGVARGSNCELETQIIIAKRRRFGAADTTAKAESLNREVGRLLNAYMKAVGRERA